MTIVFHKFASREEWLQARQNGIGASDAPTVMDVNPYSKPKKLLAAKTAADAVEAPSNPAMREGSEREPFILNLWETDRATKLTIIKDGFYTNSKYPELYASLDGEVRDGDKLVKIVEAKLVRKDETYDYDGIPEHFKLQLNQQIAICEPSSMSADIIMFSPKKDNYKIYTYEFDQVAWDAYYEKAKEFWLQVEAFKAGVRPADSPTDIIEVLKKMKAIKTQMQPLEEEYATLDAALRAYIAQSPEVVYGGITVASGSTVSRNTFDSKRFQQDQPELYAKYLKEGSSTRLTLNLDLI